MVQELSNEELFDRIDALNARDDLSIPLTPNQVWHRAMTLSVRRNQPMPKSSHAQFYWQMAIETDAADALHAANHISDKDLNLFVGVVEHIRGVIPSVVKKFSDNEIDSRLELLECGVHTILGHFLSREERLKND